MTGEPNLLDALLQRHSVRAYTAKPIPNDIARALEERAAQANAQAGLHLQLVRNEPTAFKGWRARYNRFAQVHNYLAVIARPEVPNCDMRCGYYGEQLVLLAQALGLNSCWTALAYKRRVLARYAAPGEKTIMVIALGYGQNPGEVRPSRPLASLCTLPAGMLLTQTPEWFRAGVQAASLAPTALNLQNFKVELMEDLATVDIQSTQGPMTALAAGIARYHFEVGAGAGAFTWKTEL